MSDFGQAHALDNLRRCIAEFDLDLTGRVVVAGTAEKIAVGVAVLAGARRVIAIQPEPKRRRRMSEAPQWEFPIVEFADLAGVEIVSRMEARAWQSVDILVNSSEIGPISRSIIELLPPTAVVALMAEHWEVWPGQIDIDACDEAGIAVVAPNLGHPAIGQLPELAQLCSQLVSKAGVQVCGAKIAVLCDTPCRPFIERTLADLGADVQTFPHPLLLTRGDWDAVVVALRPSEKPPMDINGLAAIRENAHNAILVQFSGEIDRVASRYFGLQIWPPKKPERGRLGLALENLGATSMFRRIVGGLKAAEALRRGAELGADTIGFVIDRNSRIG
jgi:hypothetical protein